MSNSFEGKVVDTACALDTPIGTCRISIEEACGAADNIGRQRGEAAPRSRQPPVR